MNFRVLPEANGELTEALSWFVDRLRFRAMGRLWSMWLEGLDRIATHPRMYPPAEDNRTPFEIRNYILPAYGYRIVYQLYGNDLAVLSPCRGQRRASHWLGRIQTS